MGSRPAFSRPRPMPDLFEAKAKATATIFLATSCPHSCGQSSRTPSLQRIHSTNTSTGIQRSAFFNNLSNQKCRIRYSILHIHDDITKWIYHTNTTHSMYRTYSLQQVTRGQGIEQGQGQGQWSFGPRPKPQFLSSTCPRGQRCNP